MPATASVGSTTPPAPAPIRRRRIGAGFRAFAATVLAFAVLVAANVLSMRVHARDEFGHHLRGEVSEEAKGLVSRLSGEASLIAFFERSSPLRNPARRMLSDFADLAESLPSLSLSVERIDANHDLVRAAAFAREWPGAANCIVVAAAGGRCVVLSSDQLCRKTARGDAVFAGDVPCAEALVSLLSPGGGGTFWFVRGHGEAESGGSFVGDFALPRLLRSSGYEVSARPFPGPQLPAAAPEAVAVCDAPRVPLLAAEVAEIGAFLEDGGRMLLLCGPESAGAFVPLFSRCGVSPASAPRAASGALPRAVRAEAVGAHAVASAVSGAPLAFPDPVAFEVVQSPATGAAADESRTSVLAVRSRGRRDRSRVAAEGAVEALAFAVEWPGLSASGRPGRLVVVGDGAFATEAALRDSSGNRRLLRAAAAWLAAP